MLSLASLAAVSFSVTPTLVGSDTRAVQRSTVLRCQAADPNPEEAKARDVKPRVTNAWEFRYGPGNQAFGGSPATDGSVAMISMDAPPKQPRNNAIVPREQANWPSQEDDFRFGAGGRAMSMTPAVDGSVAMISVDGPPQPRQRPTRPPAQTGDKGVVVPTNKQQYYADADNDFRHGSGAQAWGSRPAIDGSVPMITPNMR